MRNWRHRPKPCRPLRDHLALIDAAATLGEVDMREIDARADFPAPASRRRIAVVTFITRERLEKESTT
jgi:hypothetical protein